MLMCVVLSRLFCVALESGSFRPWVVSAGSFRPGLFRPKFWGESIWPILAGRFGCESLRPCVVSVQGNTQFFCISRLGLRIYC